MVDFNEMKTETLLEENITFPTLYYACNKYL